MKPVLAVKSNLVCFRPPIKGIKPILILSLLLIGGDLLAFKAGGLTIRLVTFVILLGWSFMVISKWNIFTLSRGVYFTTFSLLGAMITSLPFSVDYFRTFAYIGWAVFFFLFMVPFYYQCARVFSPSKLLDFWFLTFRIQTALILIEFLLRYLLNLEDRPHLWFYEPSYAAIYFSAYFGTALYLVMNTTIKRWGDLGLSLLASLLLASATAFFGLLISLAVCTILSRNALKTLLIAGSGLAIVLIFIAVFFAGTEFYNLLFGYLATDGAVDKSFLLLVFERSGSRIVRLLWGWDVFLANPLIGIGFGADQTYTQIHPVSAKAAEFLSLWDDVEGNPFTNPFVEAAATMGILGLAAMLVFFLVLLNLYREASRIKTSQAEYVKAMAVGLIVMFLVLQMEGTFLRYYLWSVFGMVCGAMAYLKNTKVVDRCY